MEEEKPKEPRVCPIPWREVKELDEKLMGVLIEVAGHDYKRAAEQLRELHEQIEALLEKCRGS